VAFDKDVPPYGTLGGDNMALGSDSARLDQLAHDHELPTLDQFVVIDPDEAAEITGMDPADLGLPPVQWFDAAPGLTAVRALAELLRQNPAAVPPSVARLADLEEVERELAAAEKCDARFHFCLLD
jgi:hypothetical protein